MTLRSCLLSLLLGLALGCGDDDVTLTDAGPDSLDSGMPMDGGDDGGDDGGADAMPPEDSGPGDAHVVPPDDLEIMPTDPPITVPEGTIFATLTYGPGDLQEMDVFLPDVEGPTPVVIYYHGGGFTGGQRSAGYSGGSTADVQSYLEAGMAFITVDYTLLEPGSETEGVIKSLRDCRRALQFVRYHAETLNVDPEAIGLSGGSAGAGTSLWLAFHDDMADPTSDDLIARESTRVHVAAVNSAQATYDLFRWPPDVFSPTYPLTIEELMSNIPRAAQVATFYGQPITLATDPDTLEANLRTTEYEAYRADVDMLAWMSADDPPFYVRNNAADAAPEDDDFDLLHHPLHAAALDDRAEEVGVEHIVVAPALDLGLGSGDAADFLLDHLAP